MKINDEVYVSFMSRSKLAGELCLVIGFGSKGEVKVRNEYGVVGYPQRRDVEVVGAFAHVEAAEPVAEIEDPTDLLCKVVRFELPMSWVCDSPVPYVISAYGGMWGRVSDQWYEDGVELVNIVFQGTYKVVPASCITFIED